MKILTVAENDGKSDTIAARQDNFGAYPNTRLEIEIGVDRTILFTKKNLGMPSPQEIKIKFDRIDLDGMIELLVEAKRLISEEEMYKKLVGTR